MTVTTTPGALKKFRRTPWRFQQTVERPKASRLEAFVSTILRCHDTTAGTVTIDQVVFDTNRLAFICPAGSSLTHDTSITAASAEELQALLVAAFWDGPDFIFIPTPKPLVFYADHDEWITFYANTKSHLNRVAHSLAAHGYKLVEDWQRVF